MAGSFVLATLFVLDLRAKIISFVREQIENGHLDRANYIHPGPGDFPAASVDSYARDSAAAVVAYPASLCLDSADSVDSLDFSYGPAEHVVRVRGTGPIHRMADL